MRIAIHQNKNIFDHSTLWIKPWVEFCEESNIEYQVVDCFANNALTVLKEFDCVLWHLGNYSLQEMIFARTILNSARRMGLRVFPDFNTAWHFDDKIAEYYLLKAIDAPTPESWIFYTKEQCREWLDSSAKYPFVAKLRSGSGSHNVKLMKSKSQGVSYARKMFGKGLKNSPSVLFKASSNIKSAGDWQTIVKRLKRIPDFIKTMTASKKLPNELGYAYFQEFIPNDGYDIKVVVVGDKLSFINRPVRPGDFRASGGGALNYDRSLVTKDVIESAFATSDKLGFQCMGFDYVIDNRSGKGKIIEISYGFSHTALLDAGGYFDRNGEWHEEPLNAPDEIIKNMVGGVK